MLFRKAPAKAPTCLNGFDEITGGGLSRCFTTRKDGHGFGL